MGAIEQRSTTEVHHGAAASSRWSSLLAFEIPFSSFISHTWTFFLFVSHYRLSNILRIRVIHWKSDITWSRKNKIIRYSLCDSTFCFGYSCHTWSLKSHCCSGLITVQSEQFFLSLDQIQNNTTSSKHLSKCAFNKTHLFNKNLVTH